MGHDTGDMLLQRVAERLRGCLREGDIVARLGGDESILIIHNCRVKDLRDIAERILEKQSQSFSLKGKEFFITSSIGIALYPSDGSDIETMVKNADMAMFQAKQQGRNTYQFYSHSMDEKVQERFLMEGEMHNALKREEFRLLYQPMVNLNNGMIVGMEALVNWHHPNLGLLPPLKFIPLAEETGLIVNIGEWVFHKSCHQNRIWQDAGFSPIRISVNLSARQFQQQPELYKNIKAVFMLKENRGQARNFTSICLAHLADYLYNPFGKIVMVWQACLPLDSI